MGSALALVVALGLASAPAPDAALEAVRVTLADAEIVVVGEGTRDEKLASLHQLAQQLLDARAMGRRVIGSRLDARPAAEREEFLQLFEELIVRAYLQKLLFFRKPRFAYGTVKVNEDRMIVPTKILTRNDEYFVDYEMRRNHGRWLATDVVIEGISLVRNYRSQFRTILQRQSFAELLDRMRRKTRGLQGARR
jgi:phospholipid transport system substrate-binding protein